jgi:hypothetical protein
MRESKAGSEKDRLLQDVLDRLAIAWQSGNPLQIEKTEWEVVEQFLPTGLHYCNAIAGKTGMILYDRNGYALGGVGQALIETRSKRCTVSAMRRLIYLRCFEIIQKDQGILSDAKGEVVVKGKKHLLYAALDEEEISPSGETRRSRYPSPKDTLHPEKILSMQEGSEEESMADSRVASVVSGEKRLVSEDTKQKPDSVAETEKSLREMILQVCPDKGKRQRFIDVYLINSSKRIALFEKWETVILTHPTSSELSLNPTVRDWYDTAFSVSRGTYDKAKWDLKQDMAQFLSAETNH